MLRTGSSSGELLGIDMAGMEKAEMRGVDLALQRLQVVARAHDEADADLALGKVEDLERRQCRRRARAHVDPDHAAPLHGGIGPGLHLVLEVLVGGTLGMSMQLPATSNFQP